MTRVYTVSKRVHCRIMGEVCPQNNEVFRMDESPDCKNCGWYIGWKEGRIQIEEVKL